MLRLGDKAGGSFGVTRLSLAAIWYFYKSLLYRTLLMILVTSVANRGAS